MTVVGLISDTHGLLRPEIADALRRSDYIIHAGDIGHPGIVDALTAMAPTTVVRGNNDTGTWADALPISASLSVEGARIFVIHDLKTLAPRRLPADVDVVVSGHSHRPGIDERDGVLFINPGSAGPRRFRLPVAVGSLAVTGRTIVPALWTF